MEKIVTLAVPAILLVLLVRVIMLPMKLIWRLLLNSVCGFLCLWLINTISAYTGVMIPVNLITVAVAGFLGLPGMGVLALAQVVL